MTKSSKQFALKAVSGLSTEIERHLIELHNKLKALKLSIPAGQEVPPIETSSAELIKRANDNLFEMLTMQQPDLIDQNAKLQVTDFYQNYLIPGLSALKHAFEQSANLQNYLHNDRGNDLFQLLNEITRNMQEQYKNDKNIQYTQICALLSRITHQLEDILKSVKQQRNN